MNEYIENFLDEVETTTELNHKEIFMHTLSAMALGFFASLILGTTLEKVGELINFTRLVELATDLKSLTPIIVSFAMVASLKISPFKKVGIAIAGALGGGYGVSLFGDLVAIYLSAMIALYLIINIERWKHNFQIITTPLIGILIGLGLQMSSYEVIKEGTRNIGLFVMFATDWNPWIMGPVIGLIMGLLLTFPISSAGIAFAISITGLAAGAAMAGTSAQMISFAVLTFWYTRQYGSAIAVGFGTSMLQFRNAVRRPIIFLIPSITSLLAGLSAIIFDISSSSTAAGMGTSSLIGPALTWNSDNWITIVLVTIIIPIIVSVALLILIGNKQNLDSEDLNIK